MPALAGEPLRGQAVVQIRNNVSPLTNMRGYTVSIDDVDPVAAAPGDQTFTSDPPSAGAVVAVTLRFEWAATGIPLAGAADTANIMVCLPGDGPVAGFDPGDPAQIGDSVTLSPAGDSGVLAFTLRFDVNPLDGVVDIARWGTLEVQFRVFRVAVPSWGAAYSRGGYNSPVASTANHNARGYFRRTGLLTTAPSISNVAILGAEPSPFASPDPVHTRVVYDTVSYRSQTQTLSIRRNATSVMEREEALASTLVNRDFSWTGTTSNNRRIGNGMFLGSDSKDLRMSLSALDFGGDNEYVLSATQAGGWTRDSDLQATHSNRIIVDPRYTVAHLLQIDDNVFGTPPLSKDVLNHDMLASQLGFHAVRYRNARAEGQNGFTSQVTLRDINNFVTALVFTSTTTTQGGETGWSGTLHVWDSVKPAGDWNHTGIITAPADQTALEIDGGLVSDFTLVATNPFLACVGDALAITASDRHFESGDSVRVTGVVSNSSTLVREVPGSMRVIVLRHDVTNNRVQFLNSDSDNTSAAWTTWAPAVAATAFSLAAAPADARLFFKTFSATGGWDRNIYVLFEARVSGVPYYSVAPLEETGSENKHDGYALDAIGLALSGVLSTR